MSLAQTSNVAHSSITPTSTLSPPMGFDVFGLDTNNKPYFFMSDRAREMVSVDSDNSLLKPELPKPKTCAPRNKKAGRN